MSFNIYLNLTKTVSITEEVPPETCILNMADILEKHKIWVESSGERGQKANLMGANLMEADLRGANLGGADLWEADLREANLRRADLREAYLIGGNLGGAKNLTIDKLSKTKTLYMVENLDEDLMKQVKIKYPHLVEEPK